MKRIYSIALTTLGLLGMSTSVDAQALVKNDGATLTIEAGAVLFIEGGLENTNSGTINNSGTIEVEGNFDNNDGTYTGTSDTVRFSGADDSDVTSGGAVLGVVEVEKDATKNVNLLDDAAVATELNFVNDDNRIVVGDNTLVMQDGAAISNYDDNQFVVTDGTGNLKISAIANGDSETFPVGATTTTYNPLDVTGGGSHTTDNYSVRSLEHVQDDGLVGDTLAAGVVDASWEITEDTPGGTDLNVTTNWSSTDELVDFDRTSSAIAHHDGMGWDLEADGYSPANGADPYSHSRDIDDAGVLGIASSSVTSLTIKLDINAKVFLQGPYDAGLMGDDLRSNGYIPLSEPYSAEGYVFEGLQEAHTTDASVFDPQGNTDDNIVDWVIIELRDETLDTVVASVPALIKRNGDIVALDGTGEVRISGRPAGDYYLAVRHRNHLGVRSANAIAMSAGAPVAYDFTTDINQAFDAGFLNAPMQDEGGTFVMWRGDVNGDNQVKYSGGSNDKLQILLAVGPTTPSTLVFGYNPGDVNMDGVTKYSGGSNDKLQILLVVGATTPSTVIAGHLDQN